MPLPDRSFALPEVDRAAFEDIKKAVIARTGHFYYADKDDLLWDRLHRRMKAIGVPSLDQYFGRLTGADGASEEWSALEAEITVGETFFFRYAEQFAALRDVVLPSIIRANDATRRVRIWSAGCASGAEAYSVAILLDEILGAALSDWRITILGTDLSSRAVAAARLGQFSGWALRGMPPLERGRYFTVARPGFWHLRPRYRALTRFEQHNLMSLLDGPQPVQFSEFDLILCRNVLIYFHQDVAADIASTLSACLHEKGWMFFGHAEAALLDEKTLAAVHLPGTTVYRRSGQAPATAAPYSAVINSWQPLLPAEPEVQPSQAPTFAAWRVEVAPVAIAQSTNAPPTTGVDAVSNIRGLADKGDISGALELCRIAIDGSPLSPQLQFYQGALLLASGNHSLAAASFRRALYLRKTYPMAHYYLGLALSDGGDVAAAQRAVSTAVRQSEIYPSDEVLEDSDGITAGELRAIARHYLETAEERS